MDAGKLRGWWSYRQGLDSSMQGRSPAEVLDRAGWARSVGGVGPYLTFFSRAGTSREEVDAAVERLEIHELPAARGCTYVVPASDYALALKVGQSFAEKEVRVAEKLGVTEKELQSLCDAVVRALERGPMEPDEIRDATGSAWRSLGEEGKKKGLSTTLPVALTRLQAHGLIRRIPVSGRLDQQRYRYARWKPNPLDVFDGTLEEALLEVARRFFRWVGPATLGELQWFLAIGVQASRKMADRLRLTPAAPGSERLLLPEDVDAFHAFRAPEDPSHVLVGSLDSITATRREVETLIDPKGRERMSEFARSLGKSGGFYDLPCHAIFHGGRLVGLWEYDAGEKSIVWASLEKSETRPDVSLDESETRLLAVVKSTEAFVRDQLGDARSFSLDSPKSREPKLRILREFR